MGCCFISLCIRPASDLWECLREQVLQAAHRGPFTVHSSVNAVPVYERFGFKVSGARLQRLGGTCVPMRLELPR